MKKLSIRKVVLPVAGFGTRFLPATKASPKEMLPIVDKPLIQYAVEEAVQAGITELIFIIGRSKSSIINHFDKAYELESELEKKGDVEKLAIVQNIIPKHVNCIFIRQSEPLGLGHAISCAKSVIADEPFGIILPDDLIDNQRHGVMQQMVEQFNTTQSSLIAVENVALEATNQYGIVDIGKEKPQAINLIQSIVEKPQPEQAPSTLAVVGRYIFTSEIFEYLDNIAKTVNGEIQLTDAIAKLMHDQAVQAFSFSGQRFDCGSKLGYMQAQIHYALKDKSIAASIRNYMLANAKAVKE